MTSHKNLGFTLIEIILTIAIISIIAGTSYVALTRFSAQQKLNSSYDVLKNNLNLAKSFASSQIANCTSSQTLVGYQMSYVDDDSHKIEVVCQNGANQVVNIARPLGLPDGITISYTHSPLLFLVITGEVKDIPDTGATITLTGNNGSTRSVKVFPNGRIE